jgi:hypothetical protein
VLADLERIDLGDGSYGFNVLNAKIAEPGDSAVIDPRENEIHSVYSPVRSKSIHVYLSDEWSAYGYVLTNSETDGTDVYERREFQLRDSD